MRTSMVMGLIGYLWLGVGRHAITEERYLDGYCQAFHCETPAGFNPYTMEDEHEEITIADACPAGSGNAGSCLWWGFAAATATATATARRHNLDPV